MTSLVTITGGSLSDVSIIPVMGFHCSNVNSLVVDDKAHLFSFEMSKHLLLAACCWTWCQNIRRREQIKNTLPPLISTQVILCLQGNKIEDLYFTNLQILRIKPRSPSIVDFWWYNGGNQSVFAEALVEDTVFWWVGIALDWFLKKIVGGNSGMLWWVGG